MWRIRACGIGKFMMGMGKRRNRKRGRGKRKSRSLASLGMT
jgi:hypothetical protein